MRARIAWLAVLLVGGGARAADFTSHAAHTHGVVTANVAVDGDLLSVEIDAPAINVVGFEHAPRSDTERRASEAAVAWLRAGRGLVGVPRAAACRATGIEVHTPQDDAAEHAEYRARYDFRCANPQELRWLELWLLDRLRGIARAQVNVVTRDTQTALTLSSSTGARSRRIELQAP